MQFKKYKAFLAAVIAAGMACTALMSTASAAHVERTKPEKYGDETYTQRFLSLYDDVITNGQENGYMSSDKGSGGFGVPYHSVEELICEAPDYGHETTSEAMSYLVWVAAMNDHITKENAGKIDGVTPTSDLAKAWKTLETMIPSADQQNGFWGKSELSSTVAPEHPEGIEKYPDEGNQGNTGSNPIHSKFTSAYSSEGREYLLHWLADVDDWYGFGGAGEGEKGDFTFINTFQRGDQESCFETIPHPSIETLEYGDVGGNGMKFAFETGQGSKKWSYTNAPDAEDRAIQAVYAANRWGVGDSQVTQNAAMMGDELRNDMFDKYYKEIGCQNLNSPSAGTAGQHYLMSWYTAWGGAADGAWAWQIGCSHSHQFYQNPLAAYGLLADTDLKGGMKAEDAEKDYRTSLQRQVELYLWLQSNEGPFAGGCTNSWNGKYETYPDGASTFYDMAYLEHPVYADPGSNHWTGNQFWATQRLAELYYVIKTDGDTVNVKAGGLTLEEALETMLDKWVDFFVTYTELDDNGDYSIPASLDWTGTPETWTGTYDPNANSNLHCEIVGTGNADLGCLASLSDTLVYYAKAKGASNIGADGKATPGTTLEEKALYLAQQLMDRAWKLGRDDIGVSRTDHNGSLARIWEQEVYIPAGKSGTYPHGYTVQSGSTFFDLRPMYEDLEGYDKLKAAYDQDKAAGAAMVENVGKDPDTEWVECNTDCSSFENVAAVDLDYHRFWHAGDFLITLGVFSDLYPELIPTDSDATPSETTPTTTETTTESNSESTTTTSTATTPNDSNVEWGNVNVSTEGTTAEDRVSIADAVLLSRSNTGDPEATVTDQGKLNADVDHDGTPGSGDLSRLLEFLAANIPYADLEG